MKLFAEGTIRISEAISNKQEVERRFASLLFGGEWIRNVLYITAGV